MISIIRNMRDIVIVEVYEHSYNIYCEEFASLIEIETPFMLKLNTYPKEVEAHGRK